MPTPATIPSDSEILLEGVPASAGIAIATAYLLLHSEAYAIDERQLNDEEVQIEITRFRAALVDADRILEQIETMARQDVRDRAEIFEALRMMLSDPTLAEAIEKCIAERRCSARHGIALEMDRLASIFSASHDETIRTRAEDMRSLQAHLVSSLVKTPADHRFHDDAVLILPSLSPSDAVLYARNGARAFALEAGGINSHAAILARAFGLPMVAGLKEVATVVRPHDRIIVDGYSGRVIINPDPETVEHYRKRKDELEAQRAQLGALRHLPAVTTDGVKVVLAANLDMIDEIDVAVENGAEEIGLMRTEYLVMDRDGAVTMEDQLQYYRQIAERAYPLSVTLRAFDIGSEKLAGEAWGGRSSPLGMRGTRLLLARQEIFERQIEAVMRASTMKNLKLMLPMVISVSEIRQTKELIAAVCTRLRDEGVRFDEHLQIGAMIETPAAALMAESLAAECSFLSLGTNDLAQYTLAVDREDDALAEFYDELHPAVLRLIRCTALAAARHDIPLTICGELAANEQATKILLGFGIRRFSVQPHKLGVLKQAIRSIDSSGCGVLARGASRCATAGDVRELVGPARLQRT